jgi:hypothetical protein
MAKTTLRSLDDFVYFTVSKKGAAPAGNPAKGAAAAAPAGAANATAAAAKGADAQKAAAAAAAKTAADAKAAADPKAAADAKAAAGAKAAATPAKAADPKAAAAAAPATPAAAAPAATATNLQTFADALGGLKPNPVTKQGTQFLTGGRTFANSQDAIADSCNSQRNSCADKAGQTNGGKCV